MVQRGGADIFQFFLALLEQPNAELRNQAALALRDIGDPQAVGPLFQAIHNPANRNNRGTLVYALERLDCSHYGKALIELLFYGNYEVKSMALKVLEAQAIDFSPADLESIEAQWEQLQRQPELCPEYPLWKEELEEVMAYVRGATGSEL